LSDLKALINLTSKSNQSFGIKVEQKMKSFSKQFLLYLYSTYFSVNVTAIQFAINAFRHGKPFSVPYMMWMPFDYESSVLGISFTLIFQYLSPSFYCVVCVSTDMLPAYFFSAIAGMFEELEHRISQIDTELIEILPQNEHHRRKPNILQNHDQKLKKEFKSWIEIHKKLLKLTEKAQQMFSPMILVQTLLSSIVLCTTAYSMSVVNIQ
jgi:hypothetical protein